jgi:hypothetical protein
MQGFAEIPPFFLHHKAKDVSAFIALPETSPCARFREDNKSRGAGVRMEWTEPGEVLPRPPELNRLRDQIDNIYPGLDFIYR